MNLLDGMKKNNTITNTKESEYYNTTYNDNLDLFTMVSRFNTEEEMIIKFENAMNEDINLALANLLYILDIRNGKGERRIFKVLFKHLCVNYPEYALLILPFIKELGRYDYILEGIDTPINDAVINIIKNQINDDIKSSKPSLLVKWLPSHRTHNINNELAKKIMKYLNVSEKEYRKVLSSLRTKLNIVEKNLTERRYDNIDFNKVPTKAIFKYTKSYMENMGEKYNLYKKQVKEGTSKINIKGLFSYEIVKKILANNGDDELCDLMWNNQIDVLKGCNTNLLVMADTSGSMTCNKAIPFATSIGLAIYTAERNTGIFKNHFITFSDKPRLCEIKGKTIKEKVYNIPKIISGTNIDSAFELLLKTAIANKLKDKELPSHLLIISDMEFDRGVYSENGTNFDGWKKSFNNAGYNLPKIIFWNVAGITNGVAATVFDKDVAMINGFSTSILENLLNLEDYTPTKVMIGKLKKYITMLKNEAK